MVNLLEIITYILREVDRDGNPDSAQRKFGFDGKKYKEIVDVMKLDGYINCNKIYMDQSLNLDYASITSKGYNLMRKFQ